MPSELQCTADHKGYQRLVVGLPSSFVVAFATIKHLPSSSFTATTYQQETRRTFEGLVGMR